MEVTKHENKDEWREVQEKMTSLICGVERRDKSQRRDVREWQETWIYCCVAFITDEGFCARLMCSCAHHTPLRKLGNVGFLCNACVYVATCAYKYGV